MRDKDQKRKEKSHPPLAHLILPNARMFHDVSNAMQPLRPEALAFALCKRSELVPAAQPGSSCTMLLSKNLDREALTLHEGFER